MNVDWGERAVGTYADPAFPALDALLAPVVPGRDPVAVYYYPGRTLQVTHTDAAGGLLTRDAVPVGAPGGPPGPAGLLGPGERWDGDLRCVVRSFPHDPGLPTLARVAAELAAGPGDLLSYLPGRRAVLRSASADGPVVTKIGDPDSVLRNHSRHVELFAAADRGFRLSEPLELDQTRALRRERLLPGVPLVATTADPDGLAAALAEQVVALHALDPAALSALADHTAPVLLARWGRKTVRTVGRALPELAPRAAAVVDRLAADRPAGLGDAATAGIVHGDLHAANVLVGVDGPVLLDLDELGRGDPELDVAVLVGRLLLVATRADGAAAAGLLRLARAVVPAHDAAASVRGRGALRPDVLAWYLAGTLVGRQVKTCVRHLAPGLAATCEVLVTLAEAVPAGPVDTVVDRLVDRLAGLVAPAVAVPA